MATQTSLFFAPALGQRIKLFIELTFINAIECPNFRVADTSESHRVGICAAFGCGVVVQRCARRATKFVFLVETKLPMQHSFRVSRFGRVAPLLCLLTALFFSAQASWADDGYRLWMRYDSLPAPNIAVYRQQVSSIVVTGDSPTLTAIRSELARGCAGLLGQNVPLASAVNRNGALVVGTPQSSPLIKNLK